MQNQHLALRIAQFGVEMVLVMAKPTLKLTDVTLQPANDD